MLKKNLLKTSTFFLSLGCQCCAGREFVSDEEAGELTDCAHAWWQLEYYIDRVLC